MSYLAKIEPLVGDVDGVNRVFATPGGEAYIDGGNVVFVRGLPRVMGWDDGWANTDPATGVVTLNEAPEPGDDVQMLYAVVVEGVEVEVTPLAGYIEAAGELDGVLDADDAITGGIDEIALDGALDETNDLAGTIDAVEEIWGTIEVCS